MLEVLGPHAVSQVDIAAHFTLMLLISDEQNRRESTVAESLLTLGESHQERLAFDRAALMGEGLDLRGVLILSGFHLGLLALSELLMGQDFRLTVVTNFNELSCQIAILQVEEILRHHLVIEVLLICLVCIEIRVEHVISVFVHYDYFNFN